VEVLNGRVARCTELVRRKDLMLEVRRASGDVPGCRSGLVSCRLRKPLPKA
jgi:hypothetical protein